MRLGAPIFHQTGDPEKFVNAHLTKGYRAAYCPEQLTVNDTEKIRQYRESLKKNDILLAEVGAWCCLLYTSLYLPWEAADQKPY